MPLANCARLVPPIYQHPLSVRSESAQRLAANPIVLGRATLSGGEVTFLGNAYETQTGVIDFANPVRINPTLYLSVKTTVQISDETQDRRLCYTRSEWWLRHSGADT